MGGRDVGRYTLATEKLGKSMKALEAIGIITLLAKISHSKRSLVLMRQAWGCRA
jgi:hypothetical protein